MSQVRPVQGDNYFGYNPPFIGGPQNVLSKQIGIKLIQNDLLQLLLTLPGERIYRPTFGTPLRAMPFQPLTKQVLDDLRTKILLAVAQHEPRVIVANCIVTAYPSDHLITITLNCSLVNAPVVSFSVTTQVGGS